MSAEYSTIESNNKLMKIELILALWHDVKLKPQDAVEAIGKIMQEKK